MTSSNEQIRALLKRLRRELDTTELDAETLTEMHDLDRDIHALLKAADTTAGGLLARAEAMEVRFAAKHQVAEGILRELVDTLARIGV